VTRVVPSGTVANVLRARRESNPDAAAVRCGGGWLSNAQLDAVSDRIAGGLRGLGVSKGDRVAFILPNRQEHLELLFGCAKLGAIQVPVNTYLKGEFLRYQLADSGAEVVVVDAAGARALQPLLPDLAVKTVVHCDTLVADGGVTFAELRAADPAPAVDVDLADLVAILYTSGTTGPSKGCMLSNGYYTTSPPVFREHGWIADGDRVFTAFQLFHAAAHTVLMQALCTPGGSICFEPSFSASTFVRRAAQERATLIWALAPMAMAVLGQDAGGDASSDSFRLAVVPGLPIDSAREFTRRFGMAVASEIYGQTECLGITFSSLHGRRRPGTLGRPAPHLDVALVDPDDRPVPVGEIGEIVVRPRTPYAMYSGYWRKPEATLSSWRNLWHHTGDAAVADHHGFLTFVDRTKDSLRRRGENVSSFELELTVMTHPAVRRAAAVAVPSPLGEDDIKVCIVAADGAAPTARELFEFFAANLPYYAVPRYVEIRESLPTTAATDRVRKHLLRAEGITDRTWDLEAMGLTVDRDARR
jgi:crotonobetaine/carnitine-CoA ligase